MAEQQNTPDDPKVDQENTPDDPKAALLEEILADLKKQGDLKKELLRELKPPGRGETLLEIGRHPVILLILGSLFGGWLSSCYQSREWDRQQQVLSQKQKVEQKLATRDQIVEGIINAHAAAQSAVRPIFYESSASYAARDKDRSEAWDKANAEWQITRFRLTQKAELYFGDAVCTKLKEIVDQPNQTGNPVYVDINNILALVRQNPSVLDEGVKAPEAQSQAYKDLKDNIRKNVLTRLSTMKNQSKELMRLMQEEIQADILVR